MTDVPVFSAFPPVRSKQISLVPVPSVIYRRWFVVARTTHFRVGDAFTYVGPKLRYGLTTGWILQIFNRFPVSHVHLFPD